MTLDRLSEDPIEVRPTLIVGVGGTGVLICQWAYHLILQLLGRIPPFLKFIAFDTDAQEEGGPESLPASDFCNLFNHLQLGEVIRNFKRAPGLYPHLGWLEEGAPLLSDGHTRPSPNRRPPDVSQEGHPCTGR